MIKKLSLLLMSVFLSIMMQAQTDTAVTITEGGLSAALGSKAATVVTLSIYGTVNRNDYATLKAMPNLSVVMMDYATASDTILPESAFARHPSLTQVNLPSNVTTIGDSAFNRCSKLRIVNLSSKNRYIGRWAFLGCSAMTSIILPASMTQIWDQAFRGCVNLRTLTVKGKNPFFLGSSVFDDKMLDSCVLQLPAGYKNTFRANTSWNNFNLVAEFGGISVSTKNFSVPIAGGSFLCSLQTDTTWFPRCNDRWIVVDSSMRTKRDDTIKFNVIANTGAARVGTITLMGEAQNQIIITISQDADTSAPKQKVVQCTAGQLFALLTASEINNIEKLTVNGYISRADFFTMRSMPNLTDLDLSGAYAIDSTIPNYVFGNKVKLKSFYFPKNIYKIQDSAFMSCTSLTSIILPSSLENCGYEVFENCKALTSVQILSPSLLQKTTGFFSFGMFYSCTKIRTIYNARVTPDIISEIFDYSIFDSCKLYVPAGTKTAYLATNVWKSFKNIEETGGLSVSASSITLPNRATNSWITVSTDSPWKVRSVESWIRIDTATLRTAMNDTLKFSVDANYGLVRKGVITLAGFGDNTKTVEVTQAKADNLSISKDSIDIVNTALVRVAISVSSDTIWEVESNNTWLKTSIVNSDSLIIESTQRNVTGHSRSAVIRLFTYRTSKYLVITQAANPDSILTLSALSLKVAKDSMSRAVVYVKTPTPWTASIRCSWAQLANISGYGHDTIVLFVLKNPYMHSRSDSFSVVYAGQRQTVHFTQAKGDNLNIYTQNVNIGATALGRAHFHVSTDTIFTATSDQAWLTTSVTREDSVILVTNQANTTSSARVATVTVSTFTCTKNVTVTQAASVIDSSFTLSSTAVQLAKDSLSRATVNITTKGAWSVKTFASWIRFYKSSGSGNDSIIVYAFYPNSYSSPRVDSFFVTSNGITKTIFVTQAGSNALSFSTNQLYLAADSASRGLIAVNSDTTWTCYSTANWLTVLNQSGSRHDTIKVITNSANKFVGQRSATIQVRAGSTTKYISVIQYTSDTSRLSVSVNTVNIVNQSYGTASVIVYSDTAWTASSNQSWLSVNKSSGVGFDTLKFTANSGNTDSVNRVALVTVRTKTQSRVISVVQASGDTTVISATPSITLVKYADSAKIVYIYAKPSVRWTISSYASWMKFSKTSGIGNDSVAISSLSRNTSAANRNAYATINTTSRQVYVYVYQLGDETVRFQASTDTVRGVDSASMYLLDVYAKSYWHAKVNQAWVTLSDTMKYGNNSLRISLSANNGAERSAILTITNDSTSINVIIVQSAAVRAQIAGSRFKVSCEDSLQLYSASVANTYYWNTGSTSRYIIARNSGWYSLTINNYGRLNRDSCYVFFTKDLKIKTKSDSTKPLVKSFSPEIYSWEGSFNWSFGDGTSGISSSTTHQYARAGKYQVCLSFYDEQTKCFRQVCDSIQVGAAAQSCQASFSYIVNAATNSVVFTNKSTNLNRFSWNFGDGQISDSINPKHSFYNNGAYQVCLSAINQATGCQNSLCQNIYIDSIPSVIATKADFNFVTLDSNKVLFNNVSSGFTKAYWTYGDGQSFSGTQSNTHKYAIAGTYKACLSVIDNKTAHNDQICKSITIGSPICTAKAEFSALVSGDSVYFANNSIGSNLAYSWTFGDGQTSSRRNAQHRYKNAGQYLASLSIRDTITGCIDYFADFVQVGSLDCKAIFTSLVNADSLQVRFTNNSIGSNLNYYWMFGDGTFSIEKSPIKTYPVNGLYVVKLIVTNANASCSDYSIQQVQVGKFDCSADFTTYIDSASRAAYFTSQAIGLVTNYSWMFGDGAMSYKANDMHTYSQSGYYTVFLNTYNAPNNCIDSKQKTILVGSKGRDCEADFYFQVKNNAVQFFDNSAGSIVSRLWNLGDKQFAKTLNPQHTYTTSGYYNVCLTVTNDSAVSNTTCKEVPVAIDSSNSCHAEFISIIDTLTRKAEFVNRSTGTINQLKWTIDSTDFTTHDVVYTFPKAGLYIAKLAVRDTINACYDQTYSLVNVANSTTKEGIQTAFVFEPESIKLKSSGTAISFVGLNTGKPASYLWTFGDGSVDSTTSSPVHTYTRSGVYNACLIASDPITKKSDTYCSKVTIKNGVNDVVEVTDEQSTVSLFPNPCTDFTRLQYSIDSTSNVNISLLNASGSVNALLVNTVKEAGQQQFLFDTQALSSGTYYVSLKVNEVTKAVILLVKQ